MAYLQDLANDKFIPLAAHHTFGRLAASVNTTISKPYVSKLHAAIEWNGRNWLIKHLGLNGTWVNGKSIAQGESAALAVNDIIQIAEQSDPGFRVLDLSAPADMLWPADEPPLVRPPIALHKYHLLPDNDTPEIAIFIDALSQNWLLETVQNEPETFHLGHGDLIEFGGQSWQFFLCQDYGPTEARSQLRQLKELEFIFDLSLDEETTQLNVSINDKHFDLGVRTHHYLLLQLARHRAMDYAQGLDEKSRGWIYADRLASELGLDSTHMNIQIFRARKQLADILQQSFEQLVERRSGKLRFGSDKFKIYKGDTLERQAPPMVSLDHNT